jgi:hypothetical protein
VHDRVLPLETLPYLPSPAHILQYDTAGSCIPINDAVEHDQQRVGRTDPHGMPACVTRNGDSAMYLKT